MMYNGQERNSRNPMIRHIFIIAAYSVLSVASLTVRAEDAATERTGQSSALIAEDASASMQEEKSSGPPPDISEYQIVPEGAFGTPEDIKKEAPTGGLPVSDLLGKIPGVYEIPGGKETVADTQDILSLDQVIEVYKKGEYAIAFKNLEPMVANRQSVAEELMGIMYLNGQGVPKDRAKAMELLSKAAEAGRPLAEHYLGVMYFKGDGEDAPPDMIRALMWVELSLLHYQDGPGKDRVKQDRDVIYLQTTRLERSRVNEMVREWLIKHGEETLIDMQQ